MAFGIQHGPSAANAVLSTAVSPKAGGTVSPSGTNSYGGGTVVTCTFTATSGYILDHWEVDGVSQGSPASINVTMGTGTAPVNHLVVAVVVISVGASIVSGAGATPISIGTTTATITVTAGAANVATTVNPSTSNTAGNPNVATTINPSTSNTAGNPNVGLTLTGGKLTNSGTGVLSSFTTAGSGADPIGWRVWPVKKSRWEDDLSLKW
jgi:hypothetical protein